MESCCGSNNKINLKILIQDITSLIDEYTFYKCPSLSTIIFENPSSVKKFSDYSLANCISLTKRVIPSSLSLIDDKTFYECSSLKEIIFEPPCTINLIGNAALKE